MRNPHLTAPGGGPVDWTSPGWDWQAVGGVRRGGEGGCGRTRVRRCAGAPSARGAVGGGPFLPVQPPTPVPRPSSIHPLSPLLSSPARPAPRASPGSRTWRPQPVTQHTEKKEEGPRDCPSEPTERRCTDLSYVLCAHGADTSTTFTIHAALITSFLSPPLPAWLRPQTRPPRPKSPTRP